MYIFSNCSRISKIVKLEVKYDLSNILGIHIHNVRNINAFFFDKMAQVLIKWKESSEKNCLIFFYFNIFKRNLSLFLMSVFTLLN